MLNKRGQEEPTATNLVKIVIAVIGIAIIIAVVFITLRTHFGDVSLEQASSGLDYLLREMESIPLNEFEVVTLTNPQGWRLVYFEENENINIRGFEKPDSLFGKRVLCVCKSKKCNLKTCREIVKPVLEKEESISMEIKLMDINITNNIKNYSFKVLE
ncbi:MAG: hypothetical protein JSW08_01220 [archaeon]|nr:MAG: hypothetical protein JSW08_01220 [archaeon]